jgi:hypothetical protein
VQPYVMRGVAGWATAWPGLGPTSPSYRWW